MRDREGRARRQALRAQSRADREAAPSTSGPRAQRHRLLGIAEFTRPVRNGGMQELLSGYTAGGMVLVHSDGDEVDRLRLSLAAAGLPDTIVHRALLAAASGELAFLTSAAGRTQFPYLVRVLAAAGIRLERALAAPLCDRDEEQQVWIQSFTPLGGEPDLARSLIEFATNHTAGSSELIATMHSWVSMEESEWRAGLPERVTARSARSAELDRITAAFTQPLGS